MEKQLETPVMLIAFNRIKTTKKVFEQIKIARPKKFFVHIDGPRNDEERKTVEEVKKIVSNITWPCEFKTFFREKNKGITSILDAYDWFMENAGEGIILEDDSIPSQDFFKFCSEMLEKYRDDEKIMYVTGCNFQRGWKNKNDSYYFSKYPYTYGFAFWKRSWKKYDYKMKNYPELIKSNSLKKIFPNFLTLAFSSP